MVSSIWQEYTDEFWRKCIEPKCLAVRAFAFVAFATALKPIIAVDPYSVNLIAPSMWKHLENMMISTDVQLHGISYALTYVLMDLTERQIPREEKVCLEHLYEEAGDYAYMIHAYEQREMLGKPVAVVNTGDEAPLHAPTKEDSKKQQLNDPLASGAAELVRKLRAARKIPSSFMDICDIASGSTQGEDEMETEALHQLAVVWIPLLLQGNQVLDEAGAAVIARYVERLKASVFYSNRLIVTIDNFKSTNIIKITY